MILASAQAGIAKTICGGGLAPTLECDIVKYSREMDERAVTALVLAAGEYRVYCQLKSVKTEH